MQLHFTYIAVKNKHEWFHYLTYHTYYVWIVQDYPIQMQNHKTIVVRSKELFAYSIGCTEKKWCSVAQNILIIC